jgi:phenylpropionate dioxygenase-like ring-hydroxylating dioxygenase large terminal subunit
MTLQLPFRTEPTPTQWNRGGLPAWTYHSEAVLALERSYVFLTHWQVVGHENDVPGVGDWLTFDILGERAVVMRGQDGMVRAFHNLCRHRGARVVDGVQGTCRSALVCPFHGWVYNLDGTLRGASMPDSFGELDRDRFGLKPIEMELFHGFIFLRFEPGPQPAVAQLLAPFAADFAAYRSADLTSDGPSRWNTELPVNWKSVRDVDNEGYHVPLAHPGLQDLYGRDYADHQLAHGINFSRGAFGDRPGRTWSVRHYVDLSQDPEGLPPHLQKAWTYYGLFPATVFAFTPEGAQIYHEIPVSAGRTCLSGRMYHHATESRQQRLARYLAQRIDRDTSAEDRQLTIWSNESMQSRAFDGFHLSDLEYGLRAHHDRLRELIPVFTLSDPPPEAEVARRNAELLDRSR